MEGDDGSTVESFGSRMQSAAQSLLLWAWRTDSTGVGWTKVAGDELGGRGACGGEELGCRHGDTVAVSREREENEKSQAYLP